MNLSGTGDHLALSGVESLHLIYYVWGESQGNLQAMGEFVVLRRVQAGTT